VVVLVTETADKAGNVTITIAFPPHSDPVFGGEQQASGTVTEVDDDAFVLSTDDGSDLRLHMAAATLAKLGLQPCDTAAVSYHQDAGMLIADGVRQTGSSDSGDCVGNQDEQDAVGTITQVSGDQVTIDTQNHGSMTFSVDSSDVTDGYSVGDVVDVTYTGTGAGLGASDVEYVEQDATGTVTAVSDGSVTITDDAGGQPVTFTADPATGMFDGAAAGDQVDVNYHQSGAQLVADSVDDSSGPQD
jgi:preprotein translocase subunit YajC